MGTTTPGPAPTGAGTAGLTSYRGNAIAAGVLFLLCTAASILSIVPLGETIGSPVDFPELAARADGVVTTALLQFVWAATGVGIAIALYPVLRLFNATLALASVVGRLVENVFVLAGAISLLALLSLSQQSDVVPASSALQVSGDALVAVRDWGHGFIGFLAFAVGTLTYNLVMYSSRLVPRWLSFWGLLGAVASLAATLYAGFTQDFGFTTVNNVLSVPIGLQELTLAGWLIVKGFNLTALRTITPPTTRATVRADLDLQVTGARR